MTAPRAESPIQRTELSWQRTGLGLLAVGGLLGHRAVVHASAALLVTAGLSALVGLGVLGVLAPLRPRQVQRRSAADEDLSAPREIAAITAAVVLVTVAAAVAVLAVPAG
jgi:putative membrane protein